MMPIGVDPARRGAHAFCVIASCSCLLLPPLSTSLPSQSFLCPAAREALQTNVRTIRGEVLWQRCVPGVHRGQKPVNGGAPPLPNAPLTPNLHRLPLLLCCVSIGAPLPFVCAQSIMKRLGIKTVPSFHFFRDGVQIHQFRRGLPRSLLPVACPRHILTYQFFLAQRGE